MPPDRLHTAWLLCTVILCVVGLLLPTSRISYGQQAPPQYVHEVWTVEDGLPVNNVTDLLQTLDGYLWLATFDGLVRFDGVRFTVFNTGNTEALPSNRIQELLLARDGSLWLITEQFHLVRYHAGAFTHYGPETGLAGELAYDFYKDRDGVLWIAADQGVSRYLGGTLTRFAPDLVREQSTQILRDRSGALWIGTPEGLLRYDGGRLGRWTTAQGLVLGRVTALYEASDGTIWIGTEQGVSFYRDGTVQQLLVAGVPWEGNVNHFYIYPSSDTLWVGTSTGLYRYLKGRMVPFDSGSTSFSEVKSLQVGPDGHRWLSDGDRLFRDGQRVYEGDVSGYVHDREGSIWIATQASGLHRLGPALFTVYSEPEGLIHKNVYPILEDRTGALWFGTWGGGVSRRSDQGFTHYTTADGLPSNLIRTLYLDRRGAVWVGVWEGGVCRFTNGRCVSFGAEVGLSDHTVDAIHETDDGTFWFGTPAGVYRYTDGAWTPFTDAGGLPNNWVRVIYETHDGALWMGTNGNGLLVYHNGQFTGLTTADGLSSDLIRSLYEDEDGVLWIGTEGRGLNRLDPSQARAPDQATITVIRREHGLFDEVVHQILEDDLGRLWMSTNRGIFWVERAQLNAFAAGQIAQVQATAYTERAGLRNREANGGMQSAGIKASDGRLWFPTQDGAAVVDPSDIRRNDVPPPVVIEQLVLDEETILYRGATIELAAERNFEISYTALSFMAPENVRFRYQLEGFDADWQAVDSRRVAYYTNVPAGWYRFRVIASNNEGVWNEEGATLELVVAPFFYETWWFYGAAILGVLLLLAGSYRLRIRQLKARENELAEQVAARTEDLEQALGTVAAQADKLKELDAAKSRFFANVSHEFRTPLTLTIGPLEDLRDGLFGTIDQDAHVQLDLALRNARRLLRLVNQLLDVAKLEAGHLKLRAREADLVAFLHNLALAFTAAAERKRITFDVALPPDPVPVRFDADQLEKVVANLLSNAFKFTPEGGAVRLALAAPPGNGTTGPVRVQVKDSGPGIASAELGHIFERFYQVDEVQTRMQAGTGIGLSLAKELVELHGGTLVVESTEGFGSTFTVTLPLGQAHLMERSNVEVQGSRDVQGQAAEAEEAGREAGEGQAVIDLAIASIETSLSPSDPEPSALDVTTVLVVDDNADLRAYVRRHLEPAYRVAEAANGVEALAVARGLLPDLIISDVMMPELDGYGLCRALKQDRELDFIPVILLTARATTEDKVEGFTGGADAYVTKPFEMVELRARVENLIASRQRLRARFSQVRALHASPVEAVSADDAFLERVRSAVEAHLDDEAFSVEVLAAEVGQSRSQLHRRLRSLLDQSPSEVIRSIRLERAAQLLKQQAGLVSEVAYAVGFKSVSHFTACFREAYHLTPTAYMDAEGISSN